MFPVIEVIHHHDDSVKHRNDWHVCDPTFSRPLLAIDAHLSNVLCFTTDVGHDQVSLNHSHFHHARMSPLRTLL